MGCCAKLFLALFGFGRRLEGIEPAITPKDFVDNLRRIGIKVDNYRSAGPLLKKLTTYIRNALAREDYCSRDVNVMDIHWFDLEKKTNKFYFPKNTKVACMNACRRIFDEYIAEPSSFVNRFKLGKEQGDLNNMIKLRVIK